MPRLQSRVCLCYAHACVHYKGCLIHMRISDFHVNLQHTASVHGSCTQKALRDQYFADQDISSNQSDSNMTP